MTRAPNAARNLIAEGSNWTAESARFALPILLWLAKHGRTITYKQLAEELRARHQLPIKRRYTLYGRPAGKIGHALQRLADEWAEEIPPINVLIVNARSGLPGEGADFFIKRYLNPRSRALRLNAARATAIRRETIQAVHSYPDWDAVAEALGSARPTRVAAIDSPEPIKLPRPSAPHAGYLESDKHRNLKQWAARTPAFFKQFGCFPPGKVEERISSGDCLDAYLVNADTRLAIEVKASNAPDSELYRGVFQCIKYAATLRAIQIAQGDFPIAAAVLVVTRPMPTEVARLAARLRVPVLRAPAEAEAYRKPQKR